MPATVFLPFRLLSADEGAYVRACDPECGVGTEAGWYHLEGADVSLRVLYCSDHPLSLSLSPKLQENRKSESECVPDVGRFTK